MSSSNSISSGGPRRKHSWQNLEANVWQSPAAAPALQGAPKTRILESAT